MNIFILSADLEVRVLRADADVRRRDEVHAAADAGVVDGRDDGLPAPLHVRDARLPVPDVGDDGLAPLGDVAFASEVIELWVAIQ